jgi:acetyltransferase-like isoleucine patch superfamily enzyme
MVLFRLSGIEIGEDTFINMRTFFIDNYRGKGRIKFGKRVAIAPNVIFIVDSDPNNSLLKNIQGFITQGSIEVKDDAWIGAAAIIMPNVCVGRSSIIGAGAVVTKDVEDYAIMAGNPARKIGDTRDEKYK